MQHQGIDIASQQQVAAAAKHHQRQTAFGRQRQPLPHLMIVMSLGEQAGADIHAKGVERFQRQVFVQDQAHRRPFSSTSRASLACSIRSSTCSKPASPP
ncbi:hypothetical protein D3C81_1478200 [compost metagenome]